MPEIAWCVSQSSSIHCMLPAGYRTEAGPGQDMYGLSTDPYDLHSDLYNRAAHNSTPRLGNYGGIPESLMYGQDIPADMMPTSGKLHPSHCILRQAPHSVKASLLRGSRPQKRLKVWRPIFGSCGLQPKGFLIWQQSPWGMVSYPPPGQLHATWQPWLRAAIMMLII